MVGPIRTSPAHDTTPINPAESSQDAPRPPNAWILYRSAKLRELQDAESQGRRMSQAEISRVISVLWKNETEETRTYYERLAEEKKQEHLIAYPDYRYNPKSREEKEAAKKALREKKKKEKLAEKEARARTRTRQRVHASKSKTVEPQPQAPPPVQSPAIPLLAVSHAAIPVFPPPVGAGSLYYPMELYDADGPSPPISAASSPSTGSPGSTTSEASDTAVPSQIPQPTPPAATVPVHTGANPYLAYFSARASQLVYTPASFIPTSIPAVAVSAPIVQVASNGLQLNVAQESQSVFNAPDTDANAYVAAGLSDAFQGSTSLNFEVNPETFVQLAAPHDYSGPGSEGLDFSTVNVFGLDNFNPDALDAQVPADIFVDFGEYNPPNMDALDWQAWLSTPLVDSLTTDPNIAPANNDGTLTDPSSGFLFGLGPNEASEIVNALNGSSQTQQGSSSLQRALSIDLSNTETSQRPPSVYVPPSGAGMSSTRRVGGSWKPPVMEASAMGRLASPVHAS